MMPIYSMDPDEQDNFVSFTRTLVDRHPPGTPERGRSLGIVALALSSRYKASRNMEDLEECISLNRDALSLLIDDLTIIEELASALSDRYSVIGTMEDLAESISLSRKLLSFCPAGHSNHSTSLNNLAHCLSIRYDVLGNMKDLEESISLNSNALSLFLSNDPHRLPSLNNLATCLSTRYQVLGKIADLERSISLNRAALSLCPRDHPNYATYLTNLASGLCVIYGGLGRIEDLEESTLLNRNALNLCTPGHPDRAISLHNLSDCLAIRFNALGKIQDLEEAISLIRTALTLRSPGDPYRSASLHILAKCLSSRFLRVSGKIDDLDESISISRSALSFRLPGHPHRAPSLSALAFILFSRYEVLGEIEDLEECISLNRTALTLQPPGHPNRSSTLQNLALYLETRYNVFGKMEDLEESISMNRKALSLHPPGHPNRASSLNNLAYCLSTRQKVSREIEDLEECISLTCGALSCYHDAPDHTDYATSLNNLAWYLFMRYEISGIVDDLLVSIFFLRKALNLLPLRHYSLPSSLKNLAQFLSICYTLYGKIEHLEESVLYFRQALDLRYPGHPTRCLSLSSLAGALCGRYRQLKRAEDIQEALTLYEQAACDGAALVQDRLTAAVEWTIAARHFEHPSTLSAYTASLDLLNRSLITRSSVESQQSFLATDDTPRSLASEAASAAIEAGNIKLAVEYLEQGRAMLWSRIDGYKHPFQQLREVEGGTELADRLEEIGTELETYALLSNSRQSAMNNESVQREAVTDLQIKRHRTLSEEWEKLVGRIRNIEGFSHFLKAPPFDTLQLAAAEGPVILVNVSEYRSDAIIVRKDRPPVLVPLPEVRLKDVKSQKPGSATSREIIIMLKYLWDSIVSPIVHSLAELGVPKKSRLWWCPTGDLCALPLHAACRGKKSLQDMYTSSYISTLSSLIKARSKTIRPSSVPKLLVVGEPSTDLELKKVKDEVESIHALAPNKSADVLFGPEAYSHAVLAGLRNHSWVHFACHGHLGDKAQPFQASFQLNDRRLPLLDLMQAKVPNAEFAFLSACHSAEGDSVTPDESIHLSAALQFCGFRSVIGTLWEMDDEDGPAISTLFYEYMFRNPEKVDFRDSAHALNFAVKKMRKNGVPMDRLALFVHTGA